MTQNFLPAVASETPSTRINRLLHIAGLDFHILVTLLFRSWSIMAGGITVLLIPMFLSPSQQGYYYTFTAVLATQIFFELGLNHVLIQLTSHAAAHLHRVSETKFEGDVRWQYAISSLIRLSSNWNGVMASLFFITLLIGGNWFFSNKGSMPTTQWLTPWIVLVAATALNLAISARLAICEGLGEVGQVARLRLATSIAGYLLLWLLLIFGAGLWCVIATPILNALGTTWWLIRRKLASSFDVTVYTKNKYSGYTYQHDVFPLQWRIAISWVSGYFIFHFITPTVFTHQGSVVAGKLGLAITIFSAITSIGYSWIQAKIPLFSYFAARNERKTLNNIFKIQFMRALIGTVTFAATFILVVYIASLLQIKIVERIPSIPNLLLLAIIAITNTAMFSMAAYMRAHKEEPMVLLSLVSCILISGSAWVTSKIGITEVIASYALVNTFISLPWCISIFLKYYKKQFNTHI